VLPKLIFTIKSKGPKFSEEDQNFQKMIRRTNIHAENFGPADQYFQDQDFHDISYTHTIMSLYSGIKFSDIFPILYMHT